MATSARSDQLLVVIDASAPRTDGESVRIAKDVLSAGAANTKVCLPDGPEEFARALRRRGSRRPVVVGGDQALVRAVSLLHRDRELAGCALAVVPVGPRRELARSLGVPTDAVEAARTALDGAERGLDLLVDDTDGVVIGTVGIPPGFAGEDEGTAPGPGSTGLGGGGEEPASAGHGDRGGTSRASRLWRCRALFRTLASRSRGGATAGGPYRLRVEVDGVTLVDLDKPVAGVTLRCGRSGAAEVRARPAGTTPPLTATGRTFSVSGPHFRYQADTWESMPVRTRTWTVREGAWSLWLPDSDAGG
ncbi:MULTISPECIES: diacylglycerol kinase family protein [unclassified Streptomyces]|uniref:diacylglycerol kinase family protein n=1 Tax=unclassified Streptomyces TaxID=2593676 RepID=UPI001F5B60EF|nr:diacylglycerol kinase family protein [Streptomyces sp. HSG2]